MTPAKPTHTPPRQIRIGENWEKLALAAKAANAVRAEIVNDLIAWYLREPGAKQPTRPPRELWDTDVQEHALPADRIDAPATANPNRHQAD